MRRNPALAAKLEAERRLKEGISGHRTGLPKKLLDLFAPLSPPAPVTNLKKPKLKIPYTGIAQHIAEFAEPGDPEYEPQHSQACPGSPRLFANPELKAQSRLESETKQERQARIIREKKAKAEQQLEEGLKGWAPNKDPTATSDPFKTLFIARISYEATEKKLRRDFEEYGPVKSIRLVHDRDKGKSRGYAFIEYEHKNDMKLAYKMADGKKIEGKRVVVDVERGRTVSNWRPRRFGGGKGGESREAKVSKKRRGAPQPAAAAPPPEAAAAHPTPTNDRPTHEPAREPDRSQPRPRERERERSGRERPPEREPPRVRPNAPVLSPKPGSHHLVPAAMNDALRLQGREDPRTPLPRPPRDDRGRDMNGRMETPRDHDRRDRKRERHEREPGERESRDDAHRSSKRPRDRDDRSRRRERDLL